MRIQLAYRYTGENLNETEEMLSKISEILIKSGHKIYCPLLNPNRPKNKRELFLDTLKRIKEADALLSIIKSDARSEGMLMEIGCALGRGKKFFLAIQKDVKNTHMREFAERVIEFKDLDMLYKIIGDIK